MRVLGLDLGERRIGVALSDPLGLIARPLQTVLRRGTPEDLAAIAELAHIHEVERIIAGLPISLDGTMGAQARAVLAFIETLRPLCAVPIETCDERFSTVEAEERLRERGLDRRQRVQQRDSWAAAIILQAYLDDRRYPRPT